MLHFVAEEAELYSLNFYVFVLVIQKPMNITFENNSHCMRTAICFGIFKPSLYQAIKQSRKDVIYNSAVLLLRMFYQEAFSLLIVRSFKSLS